MQFIKNIEENMGVYYNFNTKAKDA